MGCHKALILYRMWGESRRRDTFGAFCLTLGLVQVTSKLEGKLQHDKKNLLLLVAHKQPDDRGTEWKTFQVSINFLNQRRQLPFLFLNMGRTVPRPTSSRQMGDLHDWNTELKASWDVDTNPCDIATLWTNMSWLTDLSCLTELKFRATVLYCTK